MFKSPGFKQSFLLLCVCNQVDIEPASRNQQVVGGKKQKRKRGKKEVVKAPRRKKKGTLELYEFAHVTELTWKLDG